MFFISMLYFNFNFNFNFKFCFSFFFFFHAKSLRDPDHHLFKHLFLSRSFHVLSSSFLHFSLSSFWSSSPFRLMKKKKKKKKNFSICILSLAFLYIDVSCLKTTWFPLIAVS
ncbi:hypothetical protein HMI55_002077 [Coelomomyces lativittatus]|nr:hypothetical protein HMI55_002077 [Coelomomyces lativittatus]